MSLASLVAWVMLAVLIAWIAIVLYATLTTLDGETRELGRERDRDRAR